MAYTNKDIYEAINELRSEISSTYVTKDSFEPVKRLVYGLVAVILTAVIVSLLGVVIVSNAKTNISTITRLIK